MKCNLFSYYGLHSIERNVKDITQYGENFRAVGWKQREENGR